MKFLISFIMLLLMGVGVQAAVLVADFDDIRLFTLKNDAGTVVEITNYGATVTSIKTLDRNGNSADIVLGYKDVAEYINAVDKPYFGSTVGRYGNRIANGRFSIEGEQYQLTINDGENHLHGGTFGFDKVVWETIGIDENSIRFRYLSKDGEQGYPGNLEVFVTYSLTESNALEISYLATSDKKTPVNLTNHTYFNLKGEGEGDILDHHLMIHSSMFTPVDRDLIPTGEIRQVSNTPFDFTKAKPIGQDISAKDKQLVLGRGYDHNFLLEVDRESKPSASVFEPVSGRYLEVFTDQPGLQFYSGNFLAGNLIGKSGKAYSHRGGFCLETQHYPDSPNQKGFPNAFLEPGDEYRTTTVYKFGVR